MTTITLKINERTKAGKAFIVMAETFFKDAKGIEIIETPTINKKNPSTLTAKVMRETDKGFNLTKTKSHNDLLQKLYS
jgi:hypothetical protein